MYLSFIDVCVCVSDMPVCVPDDGSGRYRRGNVLCVCVCVCVCVICCFVYGDGFGMMCACVFCRMEVHLGCLYVLKIGSAACGERCARPIWCVVVCVCV